jgi:pimeloyl-ACP methyl ester carboxylesterase
MAQIEARGLHFEYELSGPSNACSQTPVMLLIMGLGMQLTAWPKELLERLHAGGLRTLIYDARDLGLSSRMDQAGRPSFVWAWIKQKLGFKVTPPYSIADLADDALALADALGIERMHVVGISMGGMVAQHLAAQNPARTLSLGLLMSSSGAPDLPGANRTVSKVMLAPMPDQHDEDALVERYVTLFQTIGSPAYPTPQALLRSRARASVRRAPAPDGTRRQVLAIFADGDRSPLLKHINTPTLVVHGLADPLLPPRCGEDLAKKISGAKLVLIDGMGHDLPDGLIPEISDLLIENCRRTTNELD